MFLGKLLFKVILFPVMILLWALRFLIRAFNKISNVIIGIMMWFVLGCIIYTVIQHTWTSTMILLAIEIVLVICAAGTGVIEAVIGIICEKKL